MKTLKNILKESHKPLELHRADLNKYLNKGENKYLQHLLQDLDTILYHILELYDNNHIFDANYRAFTRTQEITYNIYANITKDLDFKTEEGAS